MAAHRPRFVAGPVRGEGGIAARLAMEQHAGGMVPGFEAAVFREIQPTPGEVHVFAPDAAVAHHGTRQAGLADRRQLFLAATLSRAPAALRIARIHLKPKQEYKYCNGSVDRGVDPT